MASSRPPSPHPVGATASWTATSGMGSPYAQIVTDELQSGSESAQSSFDSPYMLHGVDRSSSEFTSGSLWDRQQSGAPANSQLWITSFVVSLSSFPFG